MPKAECITGTLTDNDIKSLLEEGKLITENYKLESIKQSCYELRASNTYFDITDNKKRYELNSDQFILVKPKQLVVIITSEKLEVPDNILGRILTKGKLFSIGLLPVNTYADPGFVGNLGIVFYNLSNEYIKIKQNEPIAKIEFSRLHDNVIHRYSGQHGYQTKIWPIPDDMYLTKEEIKNDNRIKSVQEEINLSYGKDIGRVIKRIYGFERWLVIGASVFMALMLALIYFITNDSSNKSILDPLYALVLGVVSSVIFTLITYLATNIRRR